VVDPEPKHSRRRVAKGGRLPLDQTPDEITPMGRADAKHEVPIEEIRRTGAKPHPVQVGGAASIQPDGVAARLHPRSTIRRPEESDQRSDRVDEHLAMLAEVG
jgi:hypothetical protein